LDISKRDCSRFRIFGKFRDAAEFLVIVRVFENGNFIKGHCYEALYVKKRCYFYTGWIGIFIYEVSRENVFIRFLRPMINSSPNSQNNKSALRTHFRDSSTIFHLPLTHNFPLTLCRSRHNIAKTGVKQKIIQIPDIHFNNNLIFSTTSILPKTNFPRHHYAIRPNPLIPSYRSQ